MIVRDGTPSDRFNCMPSEFITSGIEVILAQQLLLVVETVSAAAIDVVDSAFV